VSDEWNRAYDPDAHHVVGGLPPEALSEVERIAGSIARGRAPDHLIVVVRVIWHA
jgi:hypothetical protein